MPTVQSPSQAHLLTHTVSNHGLRATCHPSKELAHSLTARKTTAACPLMSCVEGALPALHAGENGRHSNRHPPSHGDWFVMTPQEQQMLDDFLQRLVAVGGVAKDAQADALIRQRLSSQPDALYLLVQRSLLQQQALDGAKAQIAQLQAQLASQQSGGSFLGPQPGASAWGAAPPPMPQQPMPQQQPPSWRERLFGGAPAAVAPAAAPSFLSQAATTAAGVAGGMFLFDGIENLLGGHHGGGFFGGGGQPTVVENITENNTYYDDNNDRLSDRGDRDDFASNDFSSSNDADDSFDGGFDDNDSGWA
jgi:uncharacterized protein